MSDRPVRSALYLPANRASAVVKARVAPCDAVILDLEDAVAPGEKDAARQAAIDALREGGFGQRKRVVRVNCADEATAFARENIDAILLPKVSSIDDVMAARRHAPGIALWAMVESCALFADLHRFAGQAGAHGLECLVIGSNDLALEMRCTLDRSREAIAPLLTQAVVAARAQGLLVLDGVFNNLADEAGLRSEAEQGRRFGFDGKTAIHPAQLATINAAFSPSASERAMAQAIVAAFDDPANAGKGVIRVEGRMAERLHLEQARRTLALAAIDAER